MKIDTLFDLLCPYQLCNLSPQFFGVFGRNVFLILLGPKNNRIKVLVIVKCKLSEIVLNDSALWIDQRRYLRNVLS